MLPSIVFMYSGQGSQYYQMGKELFNLNPVFRSCMLQLDQLHHDITGLSVLENLYDEANTKSIPFTQTRFTSPAIFMVEYSLTQVFLANKIQPDYVLGSSLGEFAAAVTARILNLDTALNLVIKHAQLLEEYCPHGGMLAILYDAKLYETEPYLNQLSELAGVNFPTHFVVSGNIENLEKIMEQLRKKDILFQLLPVSFAYHSSLIENIRPYFLNLANEIPLKAPQIPFISCVEGEIIPRIEKDHFYKIIRSPILFQKAIQSIEKEKTAIYLDLGPSGTLATFVKYNLASSSSSQPFTVMTPFGDDIKNLNRILELELASK